MNARWQARTGLVALTMVAALAPMSPDAARGQTGNPPRVRELDAVAAVQLALATNPMSRAQDLRIERARMDVRQVESYWQLPQLSFEGLTGLVPEARGDIFNSPDTSSDLDGLGPFVRFSVEFGLPIYGFGRLKHASAAARSSLGAQESSSEQVRNELSLNVARAYWSLVAARRALDLATDLRDSYAELLAEVDAKLAEDAIDENDAFEIRSARYDIDKSYLDATESHTLARQALAELLGVPVDERIEPTGTETPTIAISAETLAQLLDRARARHPQLRALRSAVAGLDAAVGVERAQRWPLFLVGGFFGLAESGVRADQTNPFAFDEFNYRRAGAALNMRWDLNFARHRLDAVKRRLERDATAAEAEALALKVELDVGRGLARVLKNRDLLDSARETRRDTRRWLRTASDNWDLGIGETQPLIKAYVADYRLQGLVIDTQYQLDLSVAELAFAMGDFHSYLRWITDGEVSLE